MKLDYDNISSDKIADFIKYKSACIIDRDNYIVYTYTYEVSADAEYQDLFCTIHDIFKPLGIDVYCVSEKTEYDDNYYETIISGFFLVKDGIIDSFETYDHMKGVLEGIVIANKIKK